MLTGDDRPATETVLSAARFIRQRAAYGIHRVCMHRSSIIIIIIIYQPKVQQ